MTFSSDTISQPPYPGAKPEEIAEIWVAGPQTGGGGGVFSDWTTVWVQVQWGQGEPTFRFTAVERDPIPEFWNKLQIKPKDAVSIKLGGEVAVTGVVIARQTAYDANSHAVSIQGKGEQWFIWRGAVMSKSQNFPGGFVEVAKKVLAEYGDFPKVIGTIDPKEFKPPAHNQTGETVWQFLERLARDRDVILGGDHEGRILLIGQHTSDIVDEITEGVNILSCQCLINIIDWHSVYTARGQTARSDEGSPKQAAQQEKSVESQFFNKKSPLLVPVDHPVWTEQELVDRAMWEAKQGDGRIIEVNVVLYGWFTSSGKLWIQCVGQSVTFNSPMTTLVGEKLAIRTVTCTQDRQGGTRTMLELVAPYRLNDSGGFRVDSATNTKTQMPDIPTIVPGAPQ